MNSKIFIISFSMRKEGQSHKVAKYIQKVYGEKASYLNLFEAGLPLWNEDLWSNSKEWQELLNPIKAKIDNAEGLVFVVPEYSGSPAPSYSNFMVLLGSIFAHKPALITTVSNARGGSYPVSSMRSYGYKNTKINFIPDHLIIRNVESVLNPEFDEANKEDAYIRERILYTLGVLNIYAKNFVNIRKEIVLDSKYDYGM
jgi:NADPH-dependent FMN reductase